jgi:RND family efflux transporter MFP subunit
MNTNSRLTSALAVAALLLVGCTAAVTAAVPGQVGPYKVEISTEPPVIPVGKVRLTVKVTDASGKPLEGAQVRALVKMPAMNMGEKETTARPAGKPGEYVTDASFMMAGGYDARLNISGAQGTASGTVALATGQDTGAAAGGGFTPLSVLPWVIVVALVAFVLYRMRQTGQRLRWRTLATRGTLSGVILLVAMFALARYAVDHWRRPGAMTPIEAQSMEMNTPAPPGTAPVTLATVESGPVESTVRYTGQAVGYNEQDVSARTQGWLTWMPLYVGSKVTAGQVVARLDTSQIQPQIAERQAGVNMASKGVDVSIREYRQAVAEVSRMRAEVAGKRDGLAGAQAEVAAAQEERTSAEAELASMQSMVADAEAMVAAMKADQDYWQQEIGRMRTLLDKGAVSKEEYQRELAQAATADSKVKQAQARQIQVKAQVRGAQASVRKAAAMVQAAEKKVQQMASEVRAAEAAVRSTQAMADASQAKIGEAQAGVQQAKGALSSVATTQGYAEVRAQISGVVTQRVTSPGTLVNPGQAIVKVAQVSPIRLQANVAEADLARVRVGSRVVVTGQNDTRGPVVARVTSISPSVDPVARTGIVEAVVPNTDGRFLPGQFVVMDISTGRPSPALRVPVAAVRMRTPAAGGVLAAGTAQYVWVAEPAGQAGQFTVSPVEIRTGASDGSVVEVASGLKAGQQVVVSGGHYLKSGDTVVVANAPDATPAQPSAGGHEGHPMPGMSGTATPPAAGAGAANGATVEVSSAGFSPASVSLKAGVPAKLTFIRKDEQNCGNEVVLPDYGIKKSLILNQPVVVEFTPKKGEVTFSCGMNMLTGKVVAK